jgi:NAD(P)-dependent dehydrogenase (short-subunit alcohol dehydrogenase family)
VDDFTGKVAVVTGASRGIGYGIAEALVARGAKVCVTGRKPDPLAEAVERLERIAPAAMGVAGRADDPEHQAETVARVLEAYGRLDMLVNNVGINPVFGPLLDITDDAFRKILGVNVLAPLQWIRRARDAWMGEHGGAVVNIASIAGTHAAPGIGGYAVSKAALLHLTRQLAAELAPGIRVNAVAPAVVKTQFATALYADDEEGVAARYPMRRLGEPADVAAAVLYFLGDGAGWVTGQYITLDGGVSLIGGV